MDKVGIGEWNEYPELGGTVPNIIPYYIEIKAKGKIFKVQKTVSTENDNIKESPWMPDNELLKKFKNNASLVLSPSKVERAADLILGLERVASMSELMDCLCHK
jgi:hypothetical protein